MSRQYVRLLSVFGAVLLSATAEAQNYPAKTVRLLAPFSAGSGSDTISRIYAGGLAEVFGQQVIVENRAGAAGNIGAEVGARTQAIAGLDSSVALFVLDYASELLFVGDAGTTEASQDVSFQAMQGLQAQVAAIVAARGCRLARMSGSGATCFGLFESQRKAAAAARKLVAAQPGWWVQSTVLR